jgi:hypothetical protein
MKRARVSGCATGWLVMLVIVGACTEVRDEPPASLCERYAEAAERVIVDWYAEFNAARERARGTPSPEGPAVGGPNAWEFYATMRLSPMFPPPTLRARVQSRCSWRELNLVLESDEVSEYYDPEITLGSILEDLRGKEGLDAYADRMKIVVEDFDTGFYAAFDPGG